MEIIGASAVIAYEGKYIFEIQKEHKWKSKFTGIEIGIGCIGGATEGEERPLETLQRETMEEIQTPVRIFEWDQPFIITDDFNVHSLKPDAGEEVIENLFFYWQGTRRPYKDNRVCVFMGQALQDPFPDDLPGILIGGIEQLIQCFQDNLTFGESRERGIKLISRKEIPAEARIKPVGTVAMLQELYLNHSSLINHLL